MALDAITCAADQVPLGGTVWLPTLRWRGVVRYKNFCRVRVYWTSRPNHPSCGEEDIAPTTVVLWTTGETPYVVIDGRLFKLKAGVDIHGVLQRKRAAGHVAFRF